MNCLTAGLIALVACLGNPDPEIRDKVAFERLSAAMRKGDVDRETLATIESRLLKPADLAMQLALNPAITKPQLDRLLAAIAVQVSPKDSTVAYWAGEPDRLARPVIFIAQRKVHSDAEWKAWFEQVMDPKPLASWDQAFTSELGIKKHHNVRAFLLSIFATASTSDDAGIRQLLEPVRSSLKLVQ